MTAGTGPIQIISQVGPQGAASIVPGPTGPTGFTGDRGPVLIVTMTGSTPVSWSVSDGPVNIIAQTGPTGRQGDPGPQSRTAGPTGATGPQGPQGSFQTNYPGTISADTFEGNYFTSSHVLTANIGNFQTIYLNGENVYSNVLSILKNRSVTSSLLGSSADGGYKYFELLRRQPVVLS